MIRVFITLEYAVGHPQVAERLGPLAVAQQVRQRAFQDGDCPLVFTGYQQPSALVEQSVELSRAETRAGGGSGF